jgi:sugar lactone lactonase YvrE
LYPAATAAASGEAAGQTAAVRATLILARRLPASYIALSAQRANPKEDTNMKFPVFVKGVLLVMLAVFSVQGHAWIRSPAVTFATLPPGIAHPEGLTADAQGNIYAADFDVSKAAGPGNVVVFDHAGRLLRKLDISGSSPLLLGIAFHPQTNDLLVIDFGNRNVLRIDPITGISSVFAAIPGSAGPNGLAFDGAGNVYISDSFQGVIWRTAATGGAVTAWVTGALLSTTGVPPFGANGIAFNNAGTAMFVANTGNDTIVQIPVMAGGTAGTPAVFVNSINGADGLLIDGSDNIWVAANQADEIVVVDPTGRVIAKLGDFGGIDPHGAPVGLLFPASPIISGGFLYVTNLSLDLRLFGLPQAVDSQWAASVTQHTIARIRAQIPPVRGN